MFIYTLDCARYYGSWPAYRRLMQSRYRTGRKHVSMTVINPVEILRDAYVWLHIFAHFDYPIAKAIGHPRVFQGAYCRVYALGFSSASIKVWFVCFVRFALNAPGCEFGTRVPLPKSRR
jgi:hypothetical protein